MSIKERSAATTARTNVTAATALPAAGLGRHAPAALAVVRVIAGWTFLWAFLDKLFGLGFATPAERAWLAGGSPTKGFLSNSAAGPFADFYRGLAGTAVADWLFMLGLLGIGTALLLGIGIRIAGVSGAVLYVMMWSVTLPPATNPVVDDHIFGAAVLVALALAHAGDAFGLGRAWARTPLVKRAPWLR